MPPAPSEPPPEPGGSTSVACRLESASIVCWSLSSGFWKLSAFRVYDGKRRPLDPALLHEAAWLVSASLEAPSAHRQDAKPTGGERIRAKRARNRNARRKGRKGGHHLHDLIWFGVSPPSFWDEPDEKAWRRSVRDWLRTTIEREALDLAAQREAEDLDRLEVDRRAASRRERGTNQKRRSRVDLEKSERQARRRRHESETAEAADPTESETAGAFENVAGTVKEESEPAGMTLRNLGRFTRDDREYHYLALISAARTKAQAQEEAGLTRSEEIALEARIRRALPDLS